MSLTCELSGEPLSSAQPGEIVATPSGHVCLKRLLLAKLAENGGMDPFEPIRERPLSEDQLITLSASKSAPPPRPSVTSLPNLLHSIQSEYDALVLELFDTRKALEETRKELSQALYQNDAAVRVVARLSMERDEARQELERWNASVGTAPATAAAAEEEENDTQEPKSKRRKIESLMKNDLPEEDLNSMVETWQKLQPNRKPTLKAAAAAAPSQDDLAKYDEFDKKEWHKSTCKSVTCMATSGDLLVTAGTDKQLVVYHKVDKVVVHTIPLGTVATCIDSSGSLAVIGDAKGKMAVYSVEDGSSLGTWQATEGGIVDVRIHPTTKHVCVTTSAGQLTVCCLLEGSVQAVAQFAGDDSVQYTCGALHPDGLLYAAGTSTGKVHMWDFKNKVLASTLQVSSFVPFEILAGLLFEIDPLT